VSAPLVVVGDALLDVDVDGEVTRLCPDAPVPVLDAATERERPGGAALAALLTALASPRPVRLDDLVTTKDTLQLAALLDEDSTFFGDLFAHVVQWRDDLYLEDGLHRALRAALQQRHVLHARVHSVEG